MLLLVEFPTLMPILFLAYIDCEPAPFDTVVVVFPRKLFPAELLLIFVLLAFVDYLFLYASLRAVLLAIFLIFCSRSLKQPSKLTFLDMYLILLLFLYMMSNPPTCSYYPVNLNIIRITIPIN